MNVVERYRAAFTGKSMDRVPACAWIGLPLLARELRRSSLAVLRETVEDPFPLIRLQEQLGLDPIVVTVDDRWFSMHYYWRLLCSYPSEALSTWQVSYECVDQGGGFTHYRWIAQTPGGPITWGYQIGGGVVSEGERPLKDERDLALLSAYMPPSESMVVDRLADMVRIAGNAAFFTHNLLGVWGEAVCMRGLAALSIDLFERPEFVRRLSEWLTERTLRKIPVLARSGIHSILYDQSWVGAGISPSIYREFVLPYDRRVVAAAQAVGLLVSYHNCGRGMHILEDMVSTGADALETLTPRSMSGDFDLGEVKRRVGDRITLNGGYNERILAAGSPDEVRAEVRRCLDAAAGGGRYVLRTCGQILDARPGNLQAFAKEVRDHGRC